MNQNLSDDLTPSLDSAPLLRALRRRRKTRSVVRGSIVCGPLAAAAWLGFWHRPQNPDVAAAAHVAPPAHEETPVKFISKEELLDTLKDQTVALIRWPDGKEQLLIK